MCDLEQRYLQTSYYVVGALLMAWKARAIHGGATSLQILHRNALSYHVTVSKRKKQTSPLRVLLPATKEHIKSFIDID